MNKTKKPRSISLKLSELAETLGGYSYNGQIMMSKISLPNQKAIAALYGRSSSWLQLDAACLILITKGALKITIDYEEYALKKNTLLFISQFSIIGRTEFSEGSEFYNLTVKEQFIQDSMTARKPVPIGNLFEYGFNMKPYMALDSLKMESIKRCMDTIYYYLKEERGAYKPYLLGPAFYMMIVEIIHVANIQTDAHLSDEANPIKNGRKEELLRNFFELLHEYGNRLRASRFYADKLFISMQYLALILKQKTGRGTSHWLAWAIIREAKTALSVQGRSIKEVAEALGFADQSSFGKFFKKNAGLSPKKYMETM